MEVSSESVTQREIINSEEMSSQDNPTQTPQSRTGKNGKKNKTKKAQFGVLKCIICKKQFPDKYCLQHHIQLHSDTYPFECQLCPHRSKTKKYLSKHVKVVHGKRTKNKCEVCGKMFHYKSGLVNHMRTHTGEKPYKCEVCDKTFSSTYSLSTHRYIHTDEKPYKCSFCEYACRDTSTLRKHQDRHMGIEKMYQCVMCRKKCKSKRQLKMHVAEKHLDVDLKKFPCEICGKRFKEKSNLTNHVQSVHEKSKMVKCEICGTCISNKNNLALHMMTHVDVKAYKCTFRGCGKRYKDQQTLRRHTIIHFPEQQLPCDFCGKLFTRKVRRDKHMLQHQPKVKDIECDYCGVFFYNKSYLLKHIKQKHDRKRQMFMCDMCEFETHNKPSLVMHLKYAHLRKRPHHCKLCKKRFKKSESLQIHYKKYHAYRSTTKTQKQPEFAKPFVIIKQELEDFDDFDKDLLVEIKSEKIEIPECEDIDIDNDIESANINELLNQNFNKEHTILAITECNNSQSSKLINMNRNDPNTSSNQEKQKNYEPRHLESNEVVNPEINHTSLEDCSNLHLSICPGSAKDVNANTNRSIILTSNHNDRSNGCQTLCPKYVSQTLDPKSNQGNSVSNNSKQDTKVNYDAIINPEPQEIDSNHNQCGSSEFNEEISPYSNRDRDTNLSNPVDTNRQESICSLEVHQLQHNSNSLSDCDHNLPISLESNVALSSVNPKENENNSNMNLIDSNSFARDLNSSSDIMENSVTESSQNNPANAIPSKTDPNNANKITTDTCSESKITNEAIDSNDLKSHSLKYFEVTLDEDVAKSIIEHNRMQLSKIPEAVFDEFYIKHVTTINYEDYEPDDERRVEHVNIKKREYAKKCVKKILEAARKDSEVTILEEARQKYNERLENISKGIPQKEKIVMKISKNNEKKKTQAKKNKSKRNKNKSGKIKDEVKRDRRSQRKKITASEDQNEATVTTEYNKNLNENLSDAASNTSQDDTDYIDDSETKKSKGGIYLKLNTHQCYVCFKLFETKEILLEHCKEHFDVCSKKTLKKCPICEYVTSLSLRRHMRLKHKIDVKLYYSSFKDKETTGKGSRYYYNVNDSEISEIEIIPSIKNLNKHAYMKIDKRNREKKDKSVAKTKLVRKGKEWIVENVNIDLKLGDYIIPEINKNDVNQINGDNEDTYLGKMKKLSIISKNNGTKMLFPCESCDKICQTLSALKLHTRRHDPNAKPFKKKVWKHKMKGDPKQTVEKVNVTLDTQHRVSRPKPIVNRHKCDPQLIDFYENNIKGSDIEFWQFLKIYNKMGRENIKDFSDLEGRVDFGIHMPQEPVPNVNDVEGNSSNTIPKELNPVDTVHKINQLPRKKKIIKTIKKIRPESKSSYKRIIRISKSEYIRRNALKKKLREKIAQHCD